MLNWLQKLFPTKKKQDPHDPWVVYRTNFLATQPKVDVQHFPFKELLLNEGLYVYRLMFLVSESDISRIKYAITKDFPLEAEGIYFTAELSNSQNLNVHVGVNRQFNGALVEMLTNSANLLNALDDLALQTLPPWVTFPDFDPDGFYCLQGNIEGWWHFYFLPFWESLDRNERLLYLENAPYDWKNLFIDRYVDMPFLKS
jgi:hypothetical protein